VAADDVVIDLGCGTGQLAAPLGPHCAGVLAVDPEPAMLAGLRARALPGVVCVLGADTDLPGLQQLLTGTAGSRVGAVVVGNALHWMDEPATLRHCAGLVRPGGGVAVVTQGPPLWLGTAPWQQRLRQVLEQVLGPVPGTCGSDRAAVQARARLMAELGLVVHVATWRARYPVDAEWVIGHLGSALPAGTLDRGGLPDRLRTVLQEPDELVEDVVTTAVVGRRPA
jgi:SAM-dependent methyltransferase